MNEKSPSRFSSLHAIAFALSTAVVGMTTLWIGCNPLTATLGLLNAFLYAGSAIPSFVAVWFLFIYKIVLFGRDHF